MASKKKAKKQVPKYIAGGLVNKGASALGTAFGMDPKHAQLLGSIGGTVTDIATGNIPGAIMQGADLIGDYGSVTDNESMQQIGQLGQVAGQFAPLIARYGGNIPSYQQGGDPKKEIFYTDPLNNPSLADSANIGRTGQQTLANYYNMFGTPDTITLNQLDSINRAMWEDPTNYRDPYTSVPIDSIPLRQRYLDHIGKVATGQRKPYKMGGMLTQFNGNTHENGGIPLGNPAFAEVEHGETMYSFEQGGIMPTEQQGQKYIFSHNLKVPGTKQTFAAKSKAIEKAYSLRPNDKMSNATKERELAALRQSQEEVRTQKQFNDQIDLLKTETANMTDVAEFGGMLSYKDGGIFIKPSKRGTFTAAAKKRGMGVQEFASKVMANKEDYSSAMVKKANFAKNAAGWNKEDGGHLPKYSNGGGFIPAGADPDQYLLDQFDINTQDAGWEHQNPGAAYAYYQAKGLGTQNLAPMFGIDETQFPDEQLYHAAHQLFNPDDMVTTGAGLSALLNLSPTAQSVTPAQTTPGAGIGTAPTSSGITPIVTKTTPVVSTAPTTNTQQNMQMMTPKGIGQPQIGGLPNTLQSRSAADTPALQAQTQTQTGNIPFNYFGAGIQGLGLATRAAQLAKKPEPTTFDRVGTPSVNLDASRRAAGESYADAYARGLYNIRQRGRGFNPNTAITNLANKMARGRAGAMDKISEKEALMNAQMQQRAALANQQVAMQETIARQQDLAARQSGISQLATDVGTAGAGISKDIMAHDMQNRMLPLLQSGNYKFSMNPNGEWTIVPITEG